MSPSSTPHPLDEPVRAALTGPHALFARRRGRLLCYPADVTPFLAMPQDPEAADWADAAALVGVGGKVMTAGAEEPPPAGWEVTFDVEGVQLVGNDVAGERDPEAVRLGRSDLPEVLALVERTRPGPFLPRTIEMGTYLGIRRGGRLVAMAGERFRVPGHTEISAVCTDDSHRGLGLATRLIRAVAAGVRERGETPFLHAAADNTAAIRLYEALGFRLRRGISFRAVRVPADVTAGRGVPSVR
ncbi:GNAT family N-acetyltransferase [Streptomyces meridianus]|uniref:GNAT family N-acetyltransferase n=1 Tax=Streptomyces meridianus TaxID=2938945 RepID=A0ABT0X7S0_9ACTN|nr:GNAT family N-acetyltransferase [Streptomyces meridianus]MCM2578576.1 GNAT family N-acetyltransferase [Streptomyces meridianus]